MYFDEYFMGKNIVNVNIAIYFIKYYLVGVVPMTNLILYH